jgi:leucyl aminopeptidase
LPFEIAVVIGTPRAHAADLLALVVREGAVAYDKDPTATPKVADANLKELDEALAGLPGRAAVEEEFTGKDAQVLSLHTHGKVPPLRVAAIGAGKKRDADRDRDGLRAGAARAVRAAKAAGARALAIAWPCSDDDRELLREVQALAEGAELGGYRFDRYLKEKKGLKLARLELVIPERDGRTAKAQDALREAAALGQRIGRATCAARDLVNEPAAHITPRALAAEARKAAEEAGLQIEVLGRAAIEQLGMRLFLAVAQGSVEEPQLVKLSYAPQTSQPGGKPVALVGKAITFDSGGLSLKTASGMEEMKVDMAGAAAVIAAMRVVAELKPPFAVHGYFGACENLPSGTAYKPGDVIQAKTGAHVEVLNTDAEGRLVLADVIAWANEEKPAAIVDLATLTGACVVALGPFIAGLFCNDEPLANELQTAARAAGEEIWRMPLPPQMEELIKSPIADLKNTGGRYGGAINAALFLQHFVGKTPWAHLDIAGPASSDRERGYNARGGTGIGVRTLIEWLRARAAREGQEISKTN